MQEIILACPPYKEICRDGTFAGSNIAHIRLAKCNLVCWNCHSLFTRYSNKFFRYTAERIMEEVDNLGVNVIEVSGGEPMCRPIALFRVLRQIPSSRYYKILRTNGTIYSNVLRKRTGINFWSFAIKPATEFTNYRNFVNYKIISDYVRKIHPSQMEFKIITATEKDLLNIAICLREIDNRSRNKLTRHQIPIFLVPFFMKTPAQYRNVERVKSIENFILNREELRNFNVRLSLPLEGFINTERVFNANNRSS